MGRKSSPSKSWLATLKRAFRSPTKENEKNSTRRRDEYEQEEEEKKRGKNRLLFRKAKSPLSVHQQREANTTPDYQTLMTPILSAEPSRAIALAAAKAEAAAVEVARLAMPLASFYREHSAAISIQTAFRGYLARRALRALQGIVKLQALVRGQNVRNKAMLALQCMRSIARVQDRVHDQRARLSYEESRRSVISEVNGLWDFKYLHDIREGTYTAEEEEVEAMLQSIIKEAAMKRENAIAYFSSQIWKSPRTPTAGDEKELQDRSRWLNRWMETKQWESSSSRASMDRTSDTKKIAEVDEFRPYSYGTQTYRRSNFQNETSPHFIATPLHKAPLRSLSLHQTPVSPSHSKTKPLQVRSASPRCLRKEQCYLAAHSPCLGFGYFTNDVMGRYEMTGASGGTATAPAAVPNYMTATESAKARARSQIAHRQRQSTPERERGGSAKKRLSYSGTDRSHSGAGIGGTSFDKNLRSPSFKSVHDCHFGMGRKSNYFSCYKERICGEMSPCSTTDLSWLRYGLQSGD